MGACGARGGLARDGRLRAAQPLDRRLLCARLSHEAPRPPPGPLRERPRPLDTRAHAPGVAQRRVAPNARGRRRRSGARRVRGGERGAVSQATAELARRKGARSHRGRSPHSRALRRPAEEQKANPARPAGLRLVAKPRHTGGQRRRRALRFERMARQHAIHRAVSGQPSRDDARRRAGRSARLSGARRRRSGRRRPRPPPDLHAASPSRARETRDRRSSQEARRPPARRGHSKP